MEENLVPLRRTIDDFEVVYLSVIVFVGVVLNAALLSRLLTSSKQPTVRTSFSAGPYQMNSFALFKLNLCIADFCILLIHALGKVIWLITYDWRLGDTGCKLYQFLSALSFYASSNITVNIALDRLRQVYNRRPQGATSVRRVRLMLVISWVLATLCSLPQLFAWRTLEVGEEWHQCVSIFAYNAHMNSTSPAMDQIALIYEMGHLATVFWIPFSVSMISYIVIVARLLMRQQLPIKKRTVRISRPSDSDSRTESSLLYRPKETNARPIFLTFSMKARDSLRWTSRPEPVKKRNINVERSVPAWRSQLRSRVFRSAMAVVLAHTAMWLPYNCISTLRFVNYDWYSMAMAEGANFLEDLIVVNSLLNPLLYGRHPRKRSTVRY